MLPASVAPNSTNRLALEAIHAKLIDWGYAPESFAWPPKERPTAQPFPGLDAFDELSAGIFFGREADIMGDIRDLRQMRHRGSPRVMVIQATSGAGKSSFLRAGLWPKLSRTAEFVPLAVLRPAKGMITGPQGLGKGLENGFDRNRVRRSAGSINAELLAGDASDGAAKLATFMSEATQIVTETRSLAAEDARPPAAPGASSRTRPSCFREIAWSAHAGHADTFRLRQAPFEDGWFEPLPGFSK